MQRRGFLKLLAGLLPAVLLGKMAMKPPKWYGVPTIQNAWLPWKEGQEMKECIAKWSLPNTRDKNGNYLWTIEPYGK